MEELAIDQNEIATLPENIFQLDQLKFFIISHNKLKELPKGIDRLKKLEELMIDHNQIGVLPEEIKKLSCLYHLHCNFNQLKTVPRWMIEIDNNIEGMKLRDELPPVSWKGIFLEGNPLENTEVDLEKFENIILDNGLKEQLNQTLEK